AHWNQPWPIKWLDLDGMHATQAGFPVHHEYSTKFWPPLGNFGNSLSVKPGTVIQENISAAQQQGDSDERTCQINGHVGLGVVFTGANAYGGSGHGSGSNNHGGRP